MEVGNEFETSGSLWLRVFVAYEKTMTIRELWRRITSTRYTRALEYEVARQRAEIDRLRAENRALLNSILGIAGIPPIPASSADVPPPGHLAPTPGPDAPTSRPAPPPRAPGARVAIGGAGASKVLAAPTRRRSWHQINRMLEFESARKAVTSD